MFRIRLLSCSNAKCNVSYAVRIDTRENANRISVNTSCDTRETGGNYNTDVPQSPLFPACSHRDQACVYLEDPRPAGERSAVDVPREMKLSLLRWDSPDAAPSQYRRNPHFRQHKQMPSQGASKDGIEREPEAEVGWGEDVAGAAR